MRKPIIAKTSLDKPIEDLAGRTGHRILAAWAADCVERVLPYFEESYPGDDRPRQAIVVLQEWMESGIFRMAAIRKASLSAHAAARDAPEYRPARSAARAAGQAVATAHVPRHALGAALYAATAVRDAAEPSEAEEATERERAWQYRHLSELGRAGDPGEDSGRPPG